MVSAGVWGCEAGLEGGDVPRGDIVPCLPG